MTANAPPSTRRTGALRAAPHLSLVALLAVVLALAVALALSLAGEEDEPEEPQPGLLFSQTAMRGSLEPVPGTPRLNLTLRAPAPQVVWFSDRPARQSGYIPVAGFPRAWAGFGFDDDPPNAVLNLLRAADHEDTVVLELGHPRYRNDANTIRYPARTLDQASGDLSHLESQSDRRVPRRFGAASLFIDPADGGPPGGQAIGEVYARADWSGSMYVNINRGEPVPAVIAIRFGNVCGPQQEYQLLAPSGRVPIASDGSFSIPKSQGEGGWIRGDPGFRTYGPASGSGQFSADGSQVTVTADPYSWQGERLSCTFPGKTMTLPKVG